MSNKQTDAPQKLVDWANDYYGISFGHWWSTREIARKAKEMQRSMSHA